MHVETYPAFLTPRDKKPSLSSSEEKSSEFDWLESKLTRKQIYIKAKQVLCILLPSKTVQRINLYLIDLWSMSFVKEITNYI